MSRMSQAEMIALITKNVTAAVATAMATPEPAAPAAPTPAKTDKRVGRKLSEAHKAKMAEGRARRRAADAGKPVAAVAKAVPVVAPVAAAAPAARANGKAPKVAYASDTFHGNGCTLVVSKFKGRKRNYAKIGSPNDPRMSVYASYETLRELAQVLRSDAARDILAYLADCHGGADESEEG